MIKCIHCGQVASADIHDADFLAVRGGHAHHNFQAATLGSQVFGDCAETPAERRRYALLQAAAVIYASLPANIELHENWPAEMVGEAEALLAEIERREGDKR